MPNVIVGTAGHVDHGKTMLIKALTGIDTDRLKEEKERGMTIDLGFARLVLPNGQSVSIVDVPGHERFLKNMLAGAAGVDVVLMVVAADESVMPQTIEHMDILELLEVRHGVIAITKSDLVEEDWLEIVKEEIRERLAGTFLEKAPIVPVSAVSGRGINELTLALQEECEKVEGRSVVGPFRLPIDRVFSLTGFGTVVTGTLVSGTVTVGEPAEVLPANVETRIRSIQVHGHSRESAQAGMRVALNLAGVEVSQVERGAVCAAPGLLKPSRFLDVKLTLLKRAPRPLANRARVRFHVGTAELIGRIILLDRSELKPGEEAFAQFDSESPAVAFRGDRFVIRTYSPMTTIGGGTILEPVAQKHKRFDSRIITSLQTATTGSYEEQVVQKLKSSQSGLTKDELAQACGIPKDELASVIGKLNRSGVVTEVGGSLLFHREVVSYFKARITDILAKFHARHNLKPGMPKEELRNAIGKVLDSRAFTSLLSQMNAEGKIAVSEGLVSLPHYEPVLGDREKLACRDILARLEQSGLNAPSVEELLRATGLPTQDARDLLNLLVRRGEVIRVADDICLHREVISRAEQQVREFIQKNGKITVSQFRDLAGTSRKYAVPVLEYFDRQKVTRRVGDERVLFKREVG